MANVLLVDDEPDFVAAAKEMLQLHGHTVESAERLESARRLLGGAAPDVLLLDLMLPDGNGLELLEELRESPVKRVVFITGHPGIKSLIKNLSGPSVSYLTKPIGSTAYHGLPWHPSLSRLSTTPRTTSRVPPAIVAMRLCGTHGRPRITVSL